MNKNEIIELLDKNYSDFTTFVAAQSPTQFCAAPVGKWTSGQQTDHLIKAIRPVILGLRLPKFMPRLLFGKANRPSKSYADLVAKYQQKLAEGGKASRPFIPPTVAASKQAALVHSLSKEKANLLNVLEHWSESDLDTYIMPHPILGKLTIREMLFFTAYHAAHHLKSIQHF
jgi:DinB superfamily